VLGGNLEPTKTETKAVVLMTKPEELLALNNDEEQIMEEVRKDFRLIFFSVIIQNLI
jgi:hypothetical protein